MSWNSPPPYVVTFGETQTMAGTCTFAAMVESNTHYTFRSHRSWDNLTLLVSPIGGYGGTSMSMPVNFGPLPSGGSSFTEGQILQPCDSISGITVHSIRSVGGDFGFQFALAKSDFEVRWTGQDPLPKSGGQRTMRNLAGLASLGTGGPQTVPFSGKWETVAPEINGTMVIGAGATEGAIDLKSRNGRLKCTGSWVMTATGAGNTRSGDWKLSCPDGRKASGAYMVNSAGQGTGTGVDDQGHMITFAYGPN